MPLGVTVELHDVRDVDGFVNAAINRLGLRLSRDAREEMELDGFEIMCELASRFTPTHARRGSFSGYAGEFLPRRLLTAWHKANRGSHVRTRNGEGKCVWEYRPAAASLDQLVSTPGFTERGVATITRFQKPPRVTAAQAAA
jgi:hypothetical protein